MVKTAFEEYLDSKLVKCLPSPVAAPSSATALERFAAILEKFGSGAGLAEGKAKDEKFEMHINSLKSAREAIAAAEEKLKSASSTGDDASGLVDASADILGPYLRSKVSLLSQIQGKMY
jgi:cysteinyl-tRNA synthetase